MAKLSKDDKYEANVRNGFYMWHYNSQINTVKNIEDVKDLKIYVPKYEEVKLRPCPKPPLKCFVINEVLIELEKKEKQRIELLNKIQLNQIQVSQEEFFYLQKRVYQLNIQQNHSPDIEWLLNVLSTLNPNHRYFERSYYPSNEELGGRRSKQKKSAIDEQDPFFEGLPEHISKRKVAKQASCNENDLESKNSIKNSKYQNLEADKMNDFILQMRDNDFQNQNNSQTGKKEIQNIFKQPFQNLNQGFQTQQFQISNEKSKQFLNHQLFQENQIGAMIAKEFYAYQNPVQNNQSQLKKYSVFDTQASSAHVSPTKVQMKTFEIKQYKISNNSGLKINKIPQFKNSHSQLQSMKDQENSSQMDFQSISRQINQI